MGLLVSCTRSTPAHEIYRGSRGSIRVVQLNGLAYEFAVPLRVKHLLLDHPHHFICSFHGLQACDPRPLPPEEELTKGNLYFLLPFAALQTHDLVSLASQLISLSKNIEVVYAGGSVHPLKCEKDGSNQMRNSRDCNERLLTKTQSGDCGELKWKVMGICDTPQMKIAYRHYILSKNRAWTPGLCTIDERCFAY